MMFNDSEETEVTDDVEETEEVSDTTETQSEKKTETPEAKRARLKRQLAVLETKLGVSEETKEEKKPEGALLEKAFLRSAGISEKDEVDEALKTAKKWGMTVDELVDDEDWKIKLDKFRTSKSNATATSRVRGDKGSGTSTKDTPAYWIAKGTPPTPDQVPDRAVRTKIALAMMADKKNGKKFYNE